MEAERTRFELRVGTLVSPATLALFRLNLMRIPVPRKALYRIGIPEDRDVPTVLHRLTEGHVQVVEIRRCTASVSREPQTASSAPPEAAAATPGEDGVVVPFRPIGPGRSAAGHGRRPRPNAAGRGVASPRPPGSTGPALVREVTDDGAAQT